MEAKEGIRREGMGKKTGMEALGLQEKGKKVPWIKDIIRRKGRKSDRNQMEEKGFKMLRNGEEGILEETAGERRVATGGIIKGMRRRTTATGGGHTLEARPPVLTRRACLEKGLETS